jgi:purine-binding chemotaxis protein CheW
MSIGSVNAEREHAFDWEGIRQRLATIKKNRAMSIGSVDAEREHAFDWEGIRQRLATINATLAGLGEPEPEMMEQVWAQRAAQLARPPEHEEEGEQIGLVLIRLGRELYGLNAQHVLEVRPLEQITRVPRAPNWVAGVVNLRGQVFSVIDLRRFFGLPQVTGEEDDATPIVYSLALVETPDAEAVLMVNGVLAVVMLPASQIQGASDALGGLRSDYARGVIAQEGAEAQTIVVLDLPALLADERLVVHEEVI